MLVCSWRGVSKTANRDKKEPSRKGWLPPADRRDKDRVNLSEAHVYRSWLTRTLGASLLFFFLCFCGNSSLLTPLSLSLSVCSFFLSFRWKGSSVRLALYSSQPHDTSTERECERERERKKKVLIHTCC